MRHAGKLLCWVGATVLGIIGCHSQPNLKPPETPEVLAVPDPADKRYSQAPQYPQDVLADDPVKKALGQQQTPATSGRSGPKPGSMGMGGGPGGMGP